MIVIMYILILILLILYFKFKPSLDYIEQGDVEKLLLWYNIGGRYGEIERDFIVLYEK